MQFIFWYLKLLINQIVLGKNGFEPPDKVYNIDHVLKKPIMKFLIVIASLVVLYSSCKEDPQEPVLPDPTPNLATFEGEIGTNDNSTIISNDNNLLICGNTGSIGSGICLIKISKTGAQIWRKDIIVGNGTFASSIAESSDNDLFISGSDLAKSDGLLVKTNSSGDTLWTKSYGGVGVDYGDYIISLDDGNLLICGRTCKTTFGDSCGIFLMKVNTNGETIWTNTFLEEEQIVPYHLLQTQNGEYLITGMSVSSPLIRKLYLLKVNSLGIRTWSKIFESTSDQWGSSTAELSNGDLITCGGAADTGYNQILIIRTDGQGNVLWEKEFGEDYLSEIGEAILVNFDGTFTMTGGSSEIHGSHREVIILKVDQNGNQLVLNGFGRTLFDYGHNILKDDNDDNLITGQYNGKIFFTRTDNNCVFK